MKTKVLFLIDKPVDEFTGKDEKIVGGEVFAYFPEMIHSFNWYSPDNMTCYSHIGQHSACHPDYAKECKEATPEQYNDLKRELEGLGYELEVLSNDEEFTKIEYRQFISENYMNDNDAPTYEEWLEEFNNI